MSRLTEPELAQIADVLDEAGYAHLVDKIYAQNARPQHDAARAESRRAPSFPVEMSPQRGTVGVGASIARGFREGA